MPLDQPGKSPVLPSTTPLVVVSLLARMNELVEVMAAEPALVMGRKFEEHKALLRRKQKLTTEYRADIKALAGQQEMLKQLPEGTRRALKIAAQKLAETADRNARTLRAAVTAVQRLIQNIIAYVRSEVLTTPTYKNPNASYLQLGNYSPTCKPVAVNRKA